MTTAQSRTARATIEDVARVAGVSTATASRVLARSAPVSETLRHRVVDAAQGLGYHVNRAARALRRDRTSMVGMVVPDLSNPFFTLLIDEVERRLEWSDMSMLICSSHGDVAVEARRLRSLVSSRVDVLMVAPVDAARSGAALRAAAEHVSVLQLDQFADGVDADRVGADEAYGMELLVDHLADQGARSAAFIGGALTDSSSRWRFDAARALCAVRGIRLLADPALLGDYSAEWGATATRTLLEGGDAPDALICGADVIALGALESLDAAGLSAPDDVLVTGFDDIGLSAHPRLAITTVRQPVGRIARTAVDLVDDIIGDSEHRPSSYALRPELVVRASSVRRSPQ